MAVGPTAATRPAPRVVIIVGPVGELTDRYRAIGAAAARDAAGWTPNVVTIFSPDATWPAVRRALQGASIVVYLGHGNGFPSPHRSALYPPTENGLGLNPVAAGDDNAHQYFGEQFLATRVRLAPHAVVLLSHLCYAAGNPEPGRPEPTLDVALQRVDNYAAGWLAAGAQAVIADTFGPLGAYLDPLLSSTEPVDWIWRSAPTFQDHVVRFPSLRTAGATALLDPMRPQGGFYRSLVWRPGLRADQVVAGAAAVPRAIASGQPPEPSLAALGVTVRPPDLVPATTASGLVAGTQARLALPITIPPGIERARHFTLGVRWQPITVDAVPNATTSPPPTGPPALSASPMPPPQASLTPNAPDIDLVVPEAPAALVTAGQARLTHGHLVLTVDLPDAPGRYRLVTTIHDSDGIAFDGPSQALIPALTVRVSAPASVAYGVVPRLTLAAGSRTLLSVRLANDGRLGWADPPFFDRERFEPADPPAPHLVARWVSLASSGTGVTDSVTGAVPRLEPNEQATVTLAVSAPTEPGSYLLVLDLVSPLHGSLAATGVPSAQIAVTVEPAAGPSRLSQQVRLQ